MPNTSTNTSNSQPKSSHSHSGKNIGLLLGGLGIVAGTVWYLRNHTDAADQEVKLASQVTIKRPPDVVYQFWKNFQNLPRTMTFIERVEPLGGDLYHWVVKGPMGPSIEWDAEIVDDEPGKLLTWHSVEGSDIQTWGSVRFKGREDGRGTELSVAFNFRAPNKLMGAAAQLLSGLENSVLDNNLRNLKSELEAGEVATNLRFSDTKDATQRYQP